MREGVGWRMRVVAVHRLMRAHRCAWRRHLGTSAVLHRVSWGEPPSLRQHLRVLELFAADDDAPVQA